MCDGIANTCGAPLPTNETDDDGDGYVECTVTTPWSGILEEGIVMILQQVSIRMLRNCVMESPIPVVLLYHPMKRTMMEMDTLNVPFRLHGLVYLEEDCNDADTSVHPNASPVCDGVDNACNDSIPSNEMTMMEMDM